jgi:hypothetical protein
MTSKTSVRPADRVSALKARQTLKMAASAHAYVRGKRMASGKLMSKSVFVRELMPQDLKVEIETLTVPDAMKEASFLAGVVGKAHISSIAADMRRRPTARPLKWSLGRATIARTIDAR